MNILEYKKLNINLLRKQELDTKDGFMNKEWNRNN